MRKIENTRYYYFDNLRSWCKDQHYIFIINFICIRIQREQNRRNMMSSNSARMGCKTLILHHAIRDCHVSFSLKTQ